MTNKSDDRRTLILDRLADHILAHGLIAASLRPLAKAAQTSDRMLLYYFADKAALMEGAIGVIAARMTVQLSARTAAEPLPYDALLARLTTILDEPEFWPFMCVWLELAARAARGDALYAGISQRIGQGFLAWGAAQLTSPDPQALARDAAKLLVAIEGMVVVKAIGLAPVARLSMC